MNKRCEAKKRDGSLCQKFPIRGRERCRLHGGNSLRGIAHPGYSSGKYVRTLPPRLQAEYDKQKQAYEAVLLSNQDEIKLIDLQLSEWTASLQDHGDNTDNWAKILVAIESRRRLTDSESKYLELSGRTLTKADALVFLGQVAKSIKAVLNRHVSDATLVKQILTSVSESIAQLSHAVDRHQTPR